MTLRTVAESNSCVPIKLALALKSWCAEQGEESSLDNDAHYSAEDFLDRRVEVYRHLNPAPDAECPNPRACYATPDWQRCGPRYDDVQIKSADGPWWGRLLAIIRFTDLRDVKHDLCAVRHYSLVNPAAPLDPLFKLPHVATDKQYQFVAADAVDDLVCLKPDFRSKGKRFFVVRELQGQLAARRCAVNRSFSDCAIVAPAARASQTSAALWIRLFLWNIPLFSPNPTPAGLLGTPVSRFPP